jgi:simple sugar transport system ATP-binding protein
MTPLLELRGVSKDFGAVRALDRVDLSLHAGEVLGLVGDNGAGKSTIVKLITGYYQPSEGGMLLNGAPAQFSSPADARAFGIETVYQDLALIDDMCLWRNFFLGKELRYFKAPISPMRVSEMRRICQQQLNALGIQRVKSVDQMTGLLSGGERQSLAITRAVHFGARVLILDEPTAALSVRETERVFESIRSARDQGLAVVYIDHNMAHVHPVADRIAVIEHGRVARTVVSGDTDVDQLKGYLTDGVRSDATSVGDAASKGASPT